jgi:hypothetical protein
MVSHNLPMTATGVRLNCRLGSRATGRPASPTAGEVELENVSAGPVVIPASLHPLQHLDLEVTNAAGDHVSAGCYGDQFSPGEAPAELRLQPGETFVAPVFLLATVPPDRRRPGTYTVRAVFDGPGLRAVSDPLTLTI